MWRGYKKIFTVLSHDIKNNVSRETSKLNCFT